jgi:hypothetical protein
MVIYSVLPNAATVTFEMFFVNTKVNTRQHGIPNRHQKSTIILRSKIYNLPRVDRALHYLRNAMQPHLQDHPSPHLSNGVWIACCETTTNQIANPSIVSRCHRPWASLTAQCKMHEFRAWRCDNKKAISTTATNTHHITELCCRLKVPAFGHNTFLRDCWRIVLYAHLAVCPMASTFS